MFTNLNGLLVLKLLLMNGSISLWYCYCLASRILKSNFLVELNVVVNGGHKAWVCIGDFNHRVDQNEKLRISGVSLNSNFHLKTFFK